MGLLGLRTRPRVATRPCKRVRDVPFHGRTSIVSLPLPRRTRGQLCTSAVGDDTQATDGVQAWASPGKRLLNHNHASDAPRAQESRQPTADLAPEILAAAAISADVSRNMQLPLQPPPSVATTFSHQVTPHQGADTTPHPANNGGTGDHHRVHTNDMAAHAQAHTHAVAGDHHKAHNNEVAAQPTAPTHGVADHHKGLNKDMAAHAIAHSHGGADHRLDLNREIEMLGGVPGDVAAAIAATSAAHFPTGHNDGAKAAAAAPQHVQQTQHSIPEGRELLEQVAEPGQHVIGGQTSMPVLLPTLPLAIAGLAVAAALVYLKQWGNKRAKPAPSNLQTTQLRLFRGAPPIATGPLPGATGRDNVKDSRESPFEEVYGLARNIASDQDSPAAVHASQHAKQAAPAADAPKVTAGTSSGAAAEQDEGRRGSQEEGGRGTVPGRADEEGQVGAPERRQADSIQPDRRGMPGDVPMPPHHGHAPGNRGPAQNLPLGPQHAHPTPTGEPPLHMPGKPYGMPGDVIVPQHHGMPGDVLRPEYPVTPGDVIVPGGGEQQPPRGGRPDVPEGGGVIAATVVASGYIGHDARRKTQSTEAKSPPAEKDPHSADPMDDAPRSTLFQATPATAVLQREYLAAAGKQDAQSTPPQEPPQSGRSAGQISQVAASEKDPHSADDLPQYGARTPAYAASGGDLVQKVAEAIHQQTAHDGREARAEARAAEGESFTQAKGSPLAGLPSAAAAPPGGGGEARVAAQPHNHATAHAGTDSMHSTASSAERTASKEAMSRPHGGALQDLPTAKVVPGGVAAGMSAEPRDHVAGDAGIDCDHRAQSLAQHIAAAARRVHGVPVARVVQGGVGAGQTAEPRDEAAGDAGVDCDHRRQSFAEHMAHDAQQRGVTDGQLGPVEGSDQGKDAARTAKVVPGGVGVDQSPEPRDQNAGDAGVDVDHRRQSFADHLARDAEERRAARDQPGGGKGSAQETDAVGAGQPAEPRDQAGAEAGLDGDHRRESFAEHMAHDMEEKASAGGYEQGSVQRTDAPRTAKVVPGGVGAGMAAEPRDQAGGDAGVDCDHRRQSFAEHVAHDKAEVGKPPPQQQPGSEGSHEGGQGERGGGNTQRQGHSFSLQPGPTASQGQSSGASTPAPPSLLPDDRQRGAALRVDPYDEDEAAPSGASSQPQQAAAPENRPGDSRTGAEPSSGAHAGGQQPQRPVALEEGSYDNEEARLAYEVAQRQGKGSVGADAELGAVLGTPLDSAPPSDPGSPSSAEHVQQAKEATPPPTPVANQPETATPAARQTTPSANPGEAHTPSAQLHGSLRAEVTLGGTPGGPQPADRVEHEERVRPGRHLEEEMTPTPGAGAAQLPATVEVDVEEHKQEAPDGDYMTWIPDPKEVHLPQRDSEQEATPKGGHGGADTAQRAQHDGQVRAGGEPGQGMTLRGAPGGRQPAETVEHEERARPGRHLEEEMTPTPGPGVGRQAEPSGHEEREQPVRRPEDETPGEAQPAAEPSKRNNGPLVSSMEEEDKFYGDEEIEDDQELKGAVAAMMLGEEVPDGTARLTAALISGKMPPGVAPDGKASERRTAGDAGKQEKQLPDAQASQGGDAGTPQADAEQLSATPPGEAGQDDAAAGVHRNTRRFGEHVEWSKEMGKDPNMMPKPRAAPDAPKGMPQEDSESQALEPEELRQIGTPVHHETHHFGEQVQWTEDFPKKTFSPKTHPADDGLPATANPPAVNLDDKSEQPAAARGDPATMASGQGNREGSQMEPEELERIGTPAHSEPHRIGQQVQWTESFEEKTFAPKTIPADDTRPAIMTPREQKHNDNKTEQRPPAADSHPRSPPAERNSPAMQSNGHGPASGPGNPEHGPEHHNGSRTDMHAHGTESADVREAETDQAADHQHLKAAGKHHGFNGSKKGHHADEMKPSGKVKEDAHLKRIQKALS